MPIHFDLKLTFEEFLYVRRLIPTYDKENPNSIITNLTCLFDEDYYRIVISSPQEMQEFAEANQTALVIAPADWSLIKVRINNAGTIAGQKFPVTQADLN